VTGEADTPRDGSEDQPDEHPQPDPGTGQEGEGANDVTKPDKKAKKRGSFLRELPVLVVVALVLALLIKTYAFQAYFIPSGSMQNTLPLYVKILVNKVVYHVRPIHRGDIIVFNGAGSWNPTPPPTPNPFDRLYHAVTGLFGAAPGQTDYIKRVIGIPGDHVACCNAQGDVTVNGVALHETSYLYPGNPPSMIKFNITVPPGRLWVMGDHRDISDDSRLRRDDPGVGTIPENEVVGRAFWIIWPPSQWRVLPIPATFQQAALDRSRHAAASRSSAAAPSLLSGPSPVRVIPAGSALPLAAGFLGAVPLTWGQRRLRQRFRRLSRRS
jgi:signal peptidase I